MNITCPHCERDVTIVDEMQSNDLHVLRVNNTEGQITLFSSWLVCPNANCKKATLNVAVRKTEDKEMGHGYYETSVRDQSPLVARRLIPRSQARTFPDYVPTAIREDYEEACAIREDSPKAAATLARRAIQGIIRDFFGVKRGTLAKEIEALKDDIDPDIYDSIETVRKVGNIGAHMEKDINVIIPVDAGEAGLLIELVETLIEDCYIARHKKQERLGRLKALGEEKDQTRKDARAAQVAQKKAP